MLVGKSWTIGRRVAAVLLGSAAVAATGILGAWVAARCGLVEWPPRPSSEFGISLGSIGAAIVFFEMALCFRKIFRGWPRIFPTKLWMWAHIWLGLICLPVIVVHTGFRFGGSFTSLTLLLFLAVIASGIWGLILQQWLPQKLLDEVPDETVASQADAASRYYLGLTPGDGSSGQHEGTGEVYHLVESLVQPPRELDDPSIRGEGGVAVEQRTKPLVGDRPARELESFRDAILIPYLERGRRARSPLAARAESERRFARLRAVVPAEAHSRIDRLEEIAGLRRQWDHQAKLDGLLHGWLPVHLFLSVAMTGFMLVHAVRALKYW